MIFKTTIVRKHELEYTINELRVANWEVGDRLFVPMKDGRVVEFIVALKNNCGTFFMSLNSVCESTLGNIEKNLAEFESNMPDCLLGIIKEIGRIHDGVYVSKKKICIPSIGNVKGKHGHSCNDDGMFHIFSPFGHYLEMFPTGKWWTDSWAGRQGHKERFWYVETVYGKNLADTTNDETSEYGIRPCFKI